MGSFERLAPTLPAVVEPPPSSLRGRRYGEDRLYLLARDPRCVVAVWEITPALHARVEGLARRSRCAVRYQLRIERRERAGSPAAIAATVDLPDALGGESWYVTLPRAGGECRALLGLDLGAGWHLLLESSWVPVAPDGPCSEEGTWDLDPQARAWLLERPRVAGPGSPISSAARFLAPGPPDRAR